MEKWELAYTDYQNGMKYKDIASKYDVALSTVKSWKTRKWNDTPKVATNEKSTRTKKEKVAYKKESPKAIESLNTNKGLNDQQKLFCLYYLQSFNATQSYIKAYGCSYETAMANGYKLLRNAQVKAELEKLKLELQSEQYFTIQDIINDYAKMWKADIKDVMTVNLTEYELRNKGGKVVTDKEGNPVIAHFNEVIVHPSGQFDGTMVKEISQGRDGISVKMYDSQKAMAELVKLLPNASLRKLEAEATIMQNKADKLTNDSQVDELLHALLNPMLAETSEVDADDTVQSETD